MAFYGKRYKIGGLYCGYVRRSGAHGQTYEIIFEREFARIEQIEAIDWGHITVEVLPGELPCPLSSDYAYELADITYNADCKYYRVSVRMARRLWGDVTGYQAEVDTLQETVAEKTKAVEKAEEEIKAQKIQVYGLSAAVTEVAAISTELPDYLALEMRDAVPEAFPQWETVLEAGEELPKGRIIEKDKQLYRVEQAVTPQAHQEPGGEGMLAVYRPIDQGHAGTEEDPIPWVYGMDCTAGLYYTYEGHKYRCVGDMKPCVWAPGSEGVYQWEKVG